MTEPEAGTGPVPDRWDLPGLQAAGFTGFVPFQQLPEAEVSTKPGVYAVLRAAAGEPRFRDVSPAGHHKGRDPAVPIDRLRAAWVPDAAVLYIGKAGVGARGTRGLRTRLNEYRRFGAGEPVGHWGGRYVFQLADADDLLVAWRPTGNADPGDVEAELIAAFQRHHGQRPFANRTAGR